MEQTGNSYVVWVTSHTGKWIPGGTGHIHGFSFDALGKLTVKQEKIKQKSLCKAVAVQLATAPFSCLPYQVLHTVPWESICSMRCLCMAICCVCAECSLLLGTGLCLVEKESGCTQHGKAEAGNCHAREVWRTAVSSPGQKQGQAAIQ